MPAALLGQKTQQQQDSEDNNVKSAFLVLIKDNGDFVLEPNINRPVVPERNPSPVEVETALLALLSELQAQKIASHVVNFQMQIAMQAREQATNQALLQQLAAQGG